MRKSDYTSARAGEFFIVATAVLAALVVSGCSKGKGAATRQMATPVLVAKVETKTIPVQIKVIGNVEAISSATIKSQVNGLLQKIDFSEGQDVKAGDLLFTIDPSTYQQQLQQAQAALARDAAQLENAQAEDKRYKELIDKDLVSREQYDQVHTNADALKGTVAADRAAVSNAQLYLGYCKITAPITGRTGNRNVHIGDLIKAQDTNAMVTINQLQPIYVTFAVAEQYLTDIKKYMAEGPLNVLAVVPSQDRPPEQGVLTFVDNAVDMNTGTIKLKATFDNPGENLWPGQFVNVTLDLTEKPHVLAVPSQAVMTGQNGQYVYVVKEDMSVEPRPVVTGTTFDVFTEVSKGLTAGETVVTDGQLQLRPGAKVEIKSPESLTPGAGTVPGGTAAGHKSGNGTGAK